MEDKINVTVNEFEVDTGECSIIKVTMSYGGEKSFEGLLIAYLGQDLAVKSAA